MKISVVGIGHVGVSVSFALTVRELCKELVLIGRSRDKTQAEAIDLAHAAALGESTMHVRAGEMADAAESDIVVLCASVPKPPGSNVSRMDLAIGNWALYGELVPPLIEQAPDAVYIVVANPVDVMTYRVGQLTGLNPSRIIGTGTIIDSARFRGLIAEQIGIHPQDIRAYILGEHGDSQFPALSVASIAGEFPDSHEKLIPLFEQAMQAGNQVLHARGYTNHAIARAVARIVRMIREDDCHTLPVSTLMSGQYGVEDVCLSLPCVIGKHGIHRVLRPALNSQEVELFRASAAAVRTGIDACTSA